MSDIATDRSIPDPRGLPGLGVALGFLHDPLGLLERMVVDHGPIFRLPLGSKDLVFLNDPVDVERVLRLDFESFGQSATQEKLLAPLLGQGIASVADHEYWNKLHTIFLPAFMPKMLQRYFVQTVRVIESELIHLDELAVAGKGIGFVRQGVFTALPRTLCMRGIEDAEIPEILGLFMQSGDYINARYLTNASALIQLLPSVRRGKRALQRIDERVCELIAFRKAHRIDEPEDMLDMLLASHSADGSVLSDKELRDNVATLFFGGQETTPSTVTWAFSFLARDTLVDTNLRGYPIKKGTAIAFPGWTIHRNAEYWDEPGRFLPERHTREAKSRRAKCAFMAFGYGQRRCIGERVGRMEAVMMLAMVSRKYLLEHAGGQLHQPRMHMSIKPAGFMPMDILQRERQFFPD